MIGAVGSPQDTQLDPDELYSFTRNLRRNVMKNPVDTTICAPSCAKIIAAARNKS
jgi:hypothetical protein